jgi:hypothetical protein
MSALKSKGTGNMTDSIGYWLSGLIALGIILIGARFFFVPQAAAAAYGVSVSQDARWEAYLSAKAVRDIACVHHHLINSTPQELRLG